MICNSIECGDEMWEKKTGGGDKIFHTVPELLIYTQYIHSQEERGKEIQLCDWLRERRVNNGTRSMSDVRSVAERVQDTLVGNAFVSALIGKLIFDRLYTMNSIVVYSHGEEN